MSDTASTADTSAKPTDGSVVNGSGAAAPEQSAATEAARVHAPDRRFLVFAALPSWLISMVLHIVLLLCLAWMSLPQLLEKRSNDLEMGTAEDTELVETPLLDSPLDRPAETPDVASEIANSDLPEVSPTELIATDPLTFSANDLDAAPPSAIDLDPLGPEVAAKNELLQQIGAIGGEGLSGRGMAARSRLVREGGGSEGSEKAVQMALKWLQRHQNPDGSWSFQVLGGRCDCRNPGKLSQAFNGATAMALLPGHCHRHLAGCSWPEKE